MLRALLTDLAEIPDCVVFTTRDARLPQLPEPVRQHVVDASCADILALWETCLHEADALWPIAPESDGILERLSQLAVEQGKCLLGSTPQAVALAASKRAMAGALTVAGVPAVPTYLPDALPNEKACAWVTKPDDGVGCTGTRHFADTAALYAWLAQGVRASSCVVQPYLDGIPASISMLCRDGRAWLLSCNCQDVRLEDGNFTFHGCVLNGMVNYWQEFEHIASAVAAATPGLAGYVGIDVIVNDSAITVLEVNPRLTTSYAGLRRASGINPARLVLDLLYNGRFTFPPVMTRQVVPIALDE